MHMINFTIIELISDMLFKQKLIMIFSSIHRFLDLHMVSQNILLVVKTICIFL